MEWVSEWDTMVWTNLSSVFSSCNLKRKEKSVFNKESRMSGTKGGEERKEKKNEKERRGGRRRRERERSSNLSISDQLQGGVLVNTKRVRAEISCNKHRHTR